MNQLSLNLIAIAVFTLTLSSLLGPIIHLNPAIPAIIAFGILGFMAIDSLQWQGQGSNLGLGLIASLSPAYRDRLLHHEAGHFLVASLLDIPITGYTLNPWEALKAGQRGQAGVSFDQEAITEQLKSTALTQQWIDRYCLLLMAGVAAEELVHGNAEGGADDRQNLNMLLKLYSPGTVDFTPKQKWAKLQARTLIENQWDAYQALVVAMGQRLSVPECQDQIKQQACITSTDLAPIDICCP
ncbi:ATP-dependent Zn protease [Roseofilum reptotaenium CS-1145]|uniref:ATP-dependent Zn protease n=1 Tax=Roseofilum reptotaenium AO1-A TaxID=1925591 RepID=A0A1L9QUQ1_9CYAN|nr:ATP-dependent Zn protease [Roseofilum reptotaenium]MDB9517663.1 ATP-dependent Zn protease [Roseofilum reptotaenium CS-1145]OJJ26379.1 hypothetical protein BI308_07150 [Roseofilum reptotaenium AO1-A]